MRSAPLLAACLASLALTSFATAQPAAREGYFIEFRARGGGVLGHTFVAYGRLDASGRVLEKHHAGLYADESLGYSPILAFALVHGNVTLKREDPRMPTLAIYHRRLNAAEYAHLRLTVRRLKATHQRWHMWFYNCNDFAAQIAREMGMVAPMTWMLPNTFVHSLKAINGP